MIDRGWLAGLTVIFGATGLYCLWRLAVGRGRGIETVVDVNHVLMSPAMVVMLWWPADGVARWVQVAVFGGAAVVFFRQLAGSVEVTARTGALLHAAMNFGMVWMLLAMPSLMPNHGDLAMDMTRSHPLVGVQAWTAMLTGVVAASLTLAAAWWLLHAVRSPGHRILCTCHALATAGTAVTLALISPGL
ncbi:DUF5134 domain-containing protein [Kribbella sp. NPDC048928]|uniref:DUF5134 domain-containing protein n=1 Tax=Kribbella sp. NPDC048928 TaxID=3364111 RepID=UPI00372375E4